MKRTQKESSSTLVENQPNNNSSQLIEREPVPDTPFTLIKFDEAWFLTLGKYRLTDPLPTKELALQDAQRADWTRVMQIMQIMIDEHNLNQKLKALANGHTNTQTENQGGTN